jgi:hypothetical protein
MDAGFACGSMVLFRSFWKKSGAPSHFFSKKDGRFRPAGGEISFRVRDRVTPVILQKLRSEHTNRAFHQMDVGFACGSMILVFFFTKMSPYVQHFCKKEIGSSALPKAIFPTKPGIA